MRQIEKIQNLLKSLPDKDIKLAESLLKQRKLEDLWELVCSDIYKVKTNEEKYQDVDISDMDILKLELVSYLDQLGIDVTSSEFIDSYDNGEINSINSLEC